MHAIARTAFVLGGLSMVAMFVLADDLAVGAKYTAPNGEYMEVVAVCSASPTSVECWTPDGSRDAATEEHLKQWFEANPRNGLPFAHKKLNRYVIARYSSGLTNYPSDSRQANDVTKEFGGNPERERYWLMWSRTDLDTRVLSMTTRVMQPNGDPLKLPFRKGAKGAAGPVTIELGPWRLNRQYRDMQGSMAFGSRGMGWSGKWLIAAALDLRPDSAQYLTFQALDKEGKPIQWVDDKGRPTKYTPPPQAAAPWRPAAANTQASPSGAFVSSSFGLAPGAQWLSTNINPKCIGYLVVRPTRLVTVRFDDLPIKPR